MGAELYEFEAQENASLDTTRILILRQSLGDQRCREIVEEVVFHMTDRLGLLQTAFEENDLEDVSILASRLAGLCEQIGLVVLARVARDLVQCVTVGDTNAISAVGARLIRLGEDSLYSVMVYADQSAL
ncbi:hypothetical protein [Amaricoccus tamworthensis]|uniref:hypothetical protein n=1 Tax=Amaricoccus tamworthensis TaxID=57002 RepID=UPI003C79BD12